MKKSDVKIGGTYSARISNRIVSVRIDGVHSKQGWNATNTATGKRIHIKSAQRLRAAGKTEKSTAKAVAKPQGDKPQSHPRPARRRPLPR